MVGIAVELLLSVGFAIVNYQHWGAYREFARRFAHDAETQRVWINGDFLRFYLEQEGALPLPLNETVRNGDLVISSKLSGQHFNSGGTVPVLVGTQTIRPRIPLRLAGIDANSAYSTTAFGLQPFDVSTGMIDELTAERFIEKQPELTFLHMNSPAAAHQIVSGVYDVENGEWRWMGQKAVVLLKCPAKPAPLQVAFYIPPQAPARVLTVLVNDGQVAQQRYPQPGPYTLSTAVISPNQKTATVAITVDQTFSAPNDGRTLGVILTAVGFEP